MGNETDGQHGREQVLRVSGETARVASAWTDRLAREAACRLWSGLLRVVRVDPVVRDNRCPARVFVAA